MKGGGGNVYESYFIFGRTFNSSSLLIQRRRIPKINLFNELLLLYIIYLYCIFKRITKVGEETRSMINTLISMKGGGGNVYESYFIFGRTFNSSSL